MKKVVLILLCLWALPASASHIVGGEFEIVYISGNQYRINMILYFDEKFGDEGARDATVNARIFRKRDNAFIMDVQLRNPVETKVNYTQPECSKGEIQTVKIVYTAVVTLSPQTFSDAQGYYLSWERCCRNYGITNIFSDDPTSPNGIYAGQTFYLEFPPVVKDGQPFINSSPRLFPPLNDFACPYRPYYVDFGGIDDDGDSLVYSLVTPLNTLTGNALPLPSLKPHPGPYPEVMYKGNFGPQNIMAGAPDLRISRDGMLTVTPTFVGLYVFAVKCEEYRDDVKIGESRRDFQMLVVDGCNAAKPPQILGKKLTDATFGYDNNMTVTFADDVSDQDRCIQVQVSDEDSKRLEDQLTERVKIRAVPLGFKGDVSGILPAEISATLNNGSTKTFDICFDRCPFRPNGTFQIGIIAYDDACTLPLMDTLKVTVNITPPPNKNAYFTKPDVADEILEGTTKSWPIAALDDDGDSLTISVVTMGFDFNAVGMSIEVTEHVDGSYQANLVWDAFCDIYDYTGQTTFTVKILAEDYDECNFSSPDVMQFVLTVLLPSNAPPVISSDLSADQLQKGIPRKVFESLAFNVFGEDRAQPIQPFDDNIRLTMQGVGFNPVTYGMSFPPAEGSGYAASQFNWAVTCGALNTAMDTLSLMFIVIDDANKCSIYNADTLHVNVLPLPPDNTAPDLTMTSTNPDFPFTNNEQDLFVGEPISLAFTSVDSDLAPQDHLVLDLLDVDGPAQPEGYEFTRVEGKGKVQSTFTWTPECSIFQNGVYSNDYRFRFLTYDNRCHNAMADTVVVDITIRDRSTEPIEFLPPNFVSADHDAELRNEFFAMVRIKDETTGELEEILPADNCLGHFVGISIYNRWGKRVFESNRRDFKWYPEEDAAGVYFYTLTFSNKEYKGSVTVRN